MAKNAVSDPEINPEINRSANKTRTSRIKPNEKVKSGLMIDAAVCNTGVTKELSGSKG
jgi:hypothetical protein